MNRQFHTTPYIFFYYIASLLFMLVIHYFVLFQDRLEQNKLVTQEIFRNIEKEEQLQKSVNLDLDKIVNRHTMLKNRTYQLLLLDSDGVTHIKENRIIGDEDLVFNLPAISQYSNSSTYPTNYTFYKDHLQGWIRLKNGYEMSVSIYYKKTRFFQESTSFRISYLLIASMMIIALFTYLNHLKLWNQTIDYANNLARPSSNTHKYNNYKAIEYDGIIIGQEFSRLGHAMSRANYQLHYRQRQLDTLAKRLERLVDHAPIPMAFIHRNGKLNFINDRFSYVFMVSLSNKTLKLTDFITGANKHAQSVLSNLHDQKIIQSIDVKNISNKKTYQLHLMPWFSSHGRVQGFTAMLNDISHINDELANKFIKINQQTARLDDYDKLWSVIGHELRTPLSGIIGMLELLNSSNLNQEQKETFETLEQTSQTMLYMLNDMLDLAKMDAGKLQLNLEQTDVLQLCMQVCDLMVSNAKRKNIELVLFIDPETTGQIITDEARLRQVLLNLIGNAIKFTKSGYVALKVSNFYISDTEQADKNVSHVKDKGGSSLRFEVIDTGIGISEEEQGNLFSYFNQANSSISAKFGGTGLGLAISKSFIKMLDGEIKLQSTFGQGSTFTIDLPINKNKITPIYQYHTDFSKLCLIAITQYDITNEYLTKIAEYIQLPAIVKTGLTKKNIQEIRQYQSNQQNNNKIKKYPTILLIDHQITLNSDIDLLNELMNFDNTATILWSINSEREIEHHFLEKFDGYLAKPLDVSYFVSEIMRLSQRNESGQVQRVSKLQHTFNQFLDDLENNNDEEQSHNVTISNNIAEHPVTKRDTQMQSSTNIELKSRSLILVAEDNPVNLKVATKILEKLGYQYLTVGNGEEVLNILSKRRGDIDMILMDCRMPVMDGLTATELIRKNGDSIPIIALTANDTDEDRMLCLRVGMDDFLSKPIKKNILQSMLSKYLV